MFRTDFLHVESRSYIYIYIVYFYFSLSFISSIIMSCIIGQKKLFLEQPGSLTGGPRMTN